jgi:ankyrin repeat protein
MSFRSKSAVPAAAARLGRLALSGPPGRRTYALPDSDAGDRLVSAAMHDDQERVYTVLLTGGVDVNHILTTDDKYGPALVEATRNNMVDVVRSLLKVDHIEIDKENSYGETALTEAARLQYFEIMNILVEAGADVNHVYRKTWTPLMEACWGKRPAVVRYLLGLDGIKVNKAAGRDGVTALLLAIDDQDEFGGAYETTMLLLNDPRVNINLAYTRKPQTPLHIAIGLDHTRTSTDQRRIVYALLRRDNIYLGTSDFQNHTPLELAVLRANESLEVVGEYDDTFDVVIALISHRHYHTVVPYGDEIIAVGATVELGRALYSSLKIDKMVHDLENMELQRSDPLPLEIIMSEIVLPAAEKRIVEAVDEQVGMQDNDTDRDFAIDIAVGAVRLYTDSLLEPTRMEDE